MPGRTVVRRRSVWMAKTGAIVGLVAFVLLVRLFLPLLSGTSRQAPLSVGLAFALIPAALWLILFFAYEVQEAEPLTYVLEVAILAGLLTGAVAIPAVRGIYHTARWLYAGPGVTLFGYICVVGAIQEFCKYLAVRYTVFENQDFDGVADGVAYGTAAGVGVATALNLWLVLSNPGVLAVPAALLIVVTTLAHASFGGIIGYALGQAKVQGRDGAILWGVLLAIVLDGLFNYALGAVTQSDLAYHPWNGLVLGAGVAIVVTVLLFRLVHLGEPAAASE
jgi:RsiW-degrading membrane proteinase PrsW (M82 family)